MKKIIFMAVACLTVAGCSDSGGGGTGVGSLSVGQRAALQCLAGSWVRCSDDGVTSTKVTLTVNGSNFYEIIESFNSNDTCSGVSDASMEFNATVIPGDIAASEATIGATEIQLITDPDIFGCGAGNPSYTVVLFSDDCQEMRPAVGAPACDFNSRQTLLDNLPFTKN